MGGAVKKSKLLRNEDVNNCFAQLCLYQSRFSEMTVEVCPEPIHGNSSQDTPVEAADFNRSEVLQETVVEEANFVVV